GTATALAAVYNNTPDRRTFDLGHVNPHFLSRRGWLQAKYSNKSDGNRGTWLVGVPFYETAARHALTTDGEAASERVLLFRDGVPDTTQFSQGQVERRALWFGLTAGFAPRVTTEDYVRLWLAGQWRRENFDSVGTTAFPRSVFGTVGGGARKSTRLNSSHVSSSYAVFCLKKKSQCCSLLTAHSPLVTVY